MTGISLLVVEEYMGVIFVIITVFCVFQLLLEYSRVAVSVFLFISEYVRINSEMPSKDREKTNPILSFYA